MGMGEVQLMAMVGALGGVKMVILSYWYTSIVGFVMACFKLMQNGQLREGLHRSLYLTLSVFGIKKQSPVSVCGESLTIPYGAAIAVGSYLAYFSMVIK